MTKNKAYYLFFLILILITVLFVRSAIKSDNVDVGTRKEKKEFVVKPVKVKLNIVKDNLIIYDYPVSLQNDDSILDMLEYLRNHKGFTYEKFAYIYGTEIDNINNIKAPIGFKWHLLNNGKDITFEIGDTNLIDVEVYEIKLEKPNNP
ncbi:hypothetical protein A3H26_03360 [candidate division WWE3 bacterium RIFCSPLOWO2_12_FULL_36_10]|uniref:DUF4430 domain-containing protein n=1 Tax=candidate division WWE3 bacterium RIFCSPLOWO2_12_FULL_36_10 TaxID=1802630 RepID=A0A1F4VKH9_UNCKA|nr:MAG: hypothetical protein A3H26_03360 [candidate division WWE3 bacterium RIFCSPLOWO2_12_FULL_36_10]